MGLRIERKDSTLILSGELDHVGAAKALTESRSWLSEGSGPARVELGGVERSESAGVALLLEWLREARRLKREIQFLNVPPQLHSLLQFFELETILLSAKVE